MKYIKDSLLNALLIALCVLTFSPASQAQCGKFSDSPNPDDAKAAHSLYRDAIKLANAAAKDKKAEEATKLYMEAFENWKTAYEMAPAADGQRNFHYVDGRKIYMDMLKKETDEAKKKEIIETVTRLYNEQIQCYGQDGEEARLLGRLGSDMFYYFRTPYTKLIETMASAVEKGGNDSEYIVFEPYATAIVYQFEKEKVDAQTARDVYTTLNDIADHNIENNEQYGTYYKASKDRMNNVFKKIEDQIFDCDYFKEKLVPMYREKPDDMETIKYVYNKLKVQDCDKSLPIMVELEQKFSALATEANAEIEAERRRSNPAYDATQLQKEGRYSEAIARYKEAIAQDSDPKNQAQFYFTIGYIQAWKQKGQLSSAKSNARKAAELNPSWGKPVALIGDIYAKQSTGCGDDWEKRLAIIAALAQYERARGMSDPGELGKKISTYRQSLPEAEEGFMRKVSAGQTVKSKCTGASVKVRFK